MTMAKIFTKCKCFYTYSKYHDIDDNTKHKENDQTFDLSLNAIWFKNL